MPSRDGSTAEYRSAGCSSCGVCCSWALWLCSAGTSRALRHEIDAGGDEDKQDQRGVEPAEVQAAGGQGLSSRSPSVAPSGRVRTNASQKSGVCETRVRKYRAAVTARPAPKTSAPT